MQQGAWPAQLACAILAGGQSRRMGQDKARLVLPDKTDLLTHLVHSLRQAGAEELYACMGTQARCGDVVDLPVTPVQDVLAHAGPLAGVQAVLSRPGRDWVAICPVDVPLMPAAQLIELWQCAVKTTADAAVLTLDGRPQFVCAVLHRRLADRAQRLLQKEHRRMADLYAYPVRTTLCEATAPHWQLESCDTPQRFRELCVSMEQWMLGRPGG